MTKLLGLGDSIKYKGKEHDVKGFTKTNDGYCVRLERKGAKLLVSFDKMFSSHLILHFLHLLTLRPRGLE